MHAKAITADRLHRPESVRDRLRRGGPLLDFISANFLYILPAVAVLGVAAGAYATFERNSYSNDLRSIMTSIIQYASTGKRLNQMTFNDLRRVVPPNIDVDTAEGMVYFGGILGDGLPMYIYGGRDAFAALGAGSKRQLVLVVGDNNTAANDSEGVCISLARTVGPAVKLIQLKIAPATNTDTQDTAANPIADVQAVADTDLYDVADAVNSAEVGTWTATYKKGLTFQKNARDKKSDELNAIRSASSVSDACAADFPMQIVYVMG